MMIRIKNVRPGMLFVSDAKLMLRPGQVAEVETLSKHAQRLVASGHLAQIGEPSEPPASVSENMLPAPHALDQAADLSRLSAQQAIAKVAEMNDPERIRECLATEKRRSVVEMLERRLKEISGGAE